MRKSSLFHHKTIKKICEKTDLTYQQKEAAGKWLSYLDAGDLEKEKSNYPIFMKTILQDTLGFPMEDIGQEDENVDMLYPKKGEKVLCVECKGTGAELDALQHRTKKEHETPIKQTWDYVGSTGSDYGICTNYKEFVLMTRNDYPHMHWFDFESIRENQEKLKEFVGIFSKESLIDNSGFVEEKRKESVGEEREFTTEFYKLFHQTRLMMIQAFQEKEGVTKDEAINYAQVYLNRLIFIFFAEDNKLLERKLFVERVENSINPNVTDSSKMVSDQILDLFKIMDEGSNKLGIVGFGGGIFEQIPSKIYFLDLRDKKSFKDITSEIKQKIKPDKKIQNLIDREKKLNPIIKNLLVMDSFDFTTEINVNILGHIFEQSISDLEVLAGDKVSKRKKDGVYYTPEYVTNYICQNTIIPYLSKSGANSVSKLIDEYRGNIEELEKKFREIKILDPACGSGAFLIEAVDILLDIHKGILGVKMLDNPERYSKNGQANLDKWNEESEAKEIIENNIYGVDKNPGSVGVTKLALFLKIASRGKKLTEYADNIKVGNSLISDKSIDKMAFDWELEFPEIFPDEKGKRKENLGFDLVLGNPPYAKEMNNSEKFRPMKQSAYKIYCQGKMDYWHFFIHRAIDLLRNGGRLGLITNTYWKKSSGASKLKKRIKEELILTKCVDFGKIKVFEGVSDKHMLHFYRKGESNSDDTTEYIPLNKEDFHGEITEENAIKKPYHDVIDDDNNFDFSSDIGVNFENCDNLGNLYDVSQGVIEATDKISRKAIANITNPKVKKGDGVFVLSKSELDLLNLNKKENQVIKKYLNSTDVRKYKIEFSQKYLIYSDKDAKLKIKNKQYPNLKKHLDEFKNFITSSNRPYGIHRFRKKKYFESPKLICKSMFSKPEFCYDNENFYVGFSFSVIIKKNPNYDLKFLLGLLNSQLGNFWFHKKGKKRGTDLDIGVGVYRKFPVFLADTSQQKKIIGIVDKLLQLNKSFAKENSNNDNLNQEIVNLNDELNELVFSLYKITPKQKDYIKQKYI